MAMDLTTKDTESWRKVWRTGLAPLLSDAALAALAAALQADDPKLIQSATTSPAPLSWAMDMPCEAACALGYCGWQGEGLTLVGEVEEYFARMCYEVDQRLGEPGGCRWFLNWFDDTPRVAVRVNLAYEVAVEQQRRARPDVVSV
jgi:hypothetical protein